MFGSPFSKGTPTGSMSSSPSSGIREVAHVRSLDGNLGLTMATDRAAGRCEVAVPFTSRDTLLASTGAVGPMRDVGDAIMAARENPEVLEVLGSPPHARRRS